MNSPTAHSGAFSTAEFVANTKVPFEGGEGGLHFLLKGPSPFPGEPLKNKMIP